VFYPLERERIQQHGGFIVPDAFGVQRVMGALNLTRSLGDGWLKPFISSAPVVSRFALDGSEEYAVVGTDGLFDVMTNRDVMYIVDSFMDGRTKRQCVKPAPINVARELVNTAVARGSMDNVTAVWASWT
jgi:protein phosphatase 2C